ncbi:MAG: hypothetical protein H0X37_11405 [Herpetosiphonaceae bacterium]|nr:hypothetical protein [Herpetosiphonaceae bacterium]
MRNELLSMEMWRRFLDSLSGSPMCQLLVNVNGSNQFHIINVQRRMADYEFARVTTWNELQTAHARWINENNKRPPYPAEVRALSAYP